MVPDITSHHAWKPVSLKERVIGILLLVHTAAVVFTSNRPFYPASVHPVSVLIPYPRELLILWSQTVRQRMTKKHKIIANSSFKQSKCQRTGYENTTTQAG